MDTLEHTTDVGNESKMQHLAVPAAGGGGGVILVPPPQFTMPSGYYTRFRVTCFHYPPDEIKLTSLLDARWISKAAMQEEKCPDTGRLHMQAYFESNVRLTFTRLQSKLSEFGWLGVSTRTADASSWVNYRYCTKEDSHTGRFRLVKGTFVRPRRAEEGKGESALSRMAADIKAGRGLRYIASEHLQAFLRHSSGVPTAISLLSADREGSDRYKIGCIILTGVTGTGKSWWARQYAAWRKQDIFAAILPDTASGRPWFDGYRGERVLLIDDLNSDRDGRLVLSRGRLLRLLDFYPLQIDCKGSFVWAQWDTIIITSNYSPESLFGNDDALMRRMTRIVNVNQREDLPDFKVDIPFRTRPAFAVPSAEENAPPEVPPQSDHDEDVDMGHVVIFTPDEDEVDPNEFNYNLF